ncbi:MAG: disulfide bond formation protein B [Thermoflexaceae bacterium]|nr:disulfide bond formation protein B [Thermoflexaceae bacterium]
MESEQYVSPVLGALSIGVVFAVLAAMLVLEAPWAGRVRDFFADHSQKAMFTVAMTATLSSLYYSEYVGFIPCEFCWFQRIAMYPLAALLLVALVSRVRLEPRYILTLAGVGLPISIYHYQLQLFPEQKGVCSGIISCTDRNVTEFGIVSIPFMAGAGFLTILLMQLAEHRVRSWRREESAGEPALATRTPARQAARR